jgi:hypothetical protein
MKRTAKVAVVGTGYLAALAIAYVALRIYISTTSAADRQTYGAMFAFGDGLYFLGVLCVASIPATGMGLFFLRPYAIFWRALSAFFILITALTFVALGIYAAEPASPWSALIPLWLLASPVFGAAAFVSGVFAPQHTSRRVLFTTAFVEGVVFVYVLLVWASPAA